MTPLHLRWTWTLESALHAGSGLSNLAVADRMIQRDPDGNPAIFGDLVKGALRLSAEQIACWLGAPTSYPDGTAEPTNPVLARIFGGHADAHFSGRVKQASRTSVIAATAIDADSGTAKGQTLRRTEFLAKGATIEASVQIWVTAEHREVVESMLVAAIAATESIGGKAGIGWGRVTPRLTDSTTSAVDPRRIQALKAALTGPPATLSERQFDTTHTAPSAKTWFRLDLDLTDPACFPVNPQTSNHQPTSTSVPSPTLRGALYAEWRRQQGSAASEALANLSAQTTWTPAMPVVDGVTWFPAPRGLLMPRTGGDVVNPLISKDDPNTPATRMVAADGWMSSDGRFCASPIATQTRMHVARHYVTGSKRSGALYSRSEVAARSKFTAWAETGSSAFETRQASIWLGRRTSVAGGAQVTVTNKPPTWPEIEEKDLPNATVVNVQLVAPALVRDERGHGMLSLPVSFWQKLSGQLCEIESARIQRTRRGGWMAQWGHQRSASWLIDSGSLWRLQFKSSGVAKAARLALRQARFIGEGRHEGHGLLLVDPEWIGHPKFTPWKRPAPGRAEEAVDTEMAVIAAKVLQLGSLTAAEKPLKQLSVWMRTVSGAPDISNIVFKCDELANRDKKNPWQSLKRGSPARKLLDDYWQPKPNVVPNADHVRFVIEALLIRSAARRGEVV